MLLPALIGGLLLSSSVMPSFAQEAQPTGEPETLELGVEVFRTVCSACHGPTGGGVPELFPPLRDNERVLDPAYVESVVREGLAGPIDVNGVTYDRVMPPPAGLTDEEIQAVAAFVSAGLEVGGGKAPPDSAGAGTVAVSLPVATVVTSGLAMLIAIAVVAGVMAPRLVATTDRLNLTWLDAWLKTSVIVAYFVLGTVVVPSLILELGAIASLPRLVRDVIGLGVWGGAVGLGLWGLWWAQRRSRV